jgi:hypothetical protein
MHTARVTWFGTEGKLHLQLKSFPAQREVKCRLDEITLPERKRHRDLLLVTRSDGAIINIGRMVPEKEAVAAMERCPVVDDGHTGFFVVLPRGYGIVDNLQTSELNVVPAGEIPPMTELLPAPEPVTVAVLEAETALDEDTGIIHGDEAEVAAEASKRAMQKKAEEDAEVDSEEEEEVEEVEEPKEEETPEGEDDDLMDLMGD